MVGQSFLRDVCRIEVRENIWVTENVSVHVILFLLHCCFLQEVFVAPFGNSSTFIDGPHDQTLSSPAVSSSENAFDIGAVVPVLCVDI